MDAIAVERFQREVIPLLGEISAAAFRLSRDRQDAEDLTQEVMLRAYAGFASFREGTNPKAWLLRILRNTWISQYRRRQCRPNEVSAECVSDYQWATVVLRNSQLFRSVEDCALELLKHEEVAAALAALPVEVRTTIYYADVLGFSRKEIAILLGRPVGTVLSRLHRGRKRLRTSLSAAATRRDNISEPERSDPSRAA